MGKHLKLFNLTSEYLAYAADISKMILPNVSYCKDSKTKIYYNQLVIPEGSDSDEPVLEGNKVLCKYNVSDTSSPITLYYQESSGSGSGSGSDSVEVVPIFSSMEVDGVEQEITNEYIFDTTGEHTVLFTLLESETSIDENAFQDCSGLTSVIIGNSVTSIGDSAFNGCSGLTSVIIGNSLTSIGWHVFYDCSELTSIVVAANNQKYDSRNNCNAIIETSTNKLITGCKNTIIPDSVTAIGGNAFQDCSGLTSITIPDSVTSIGNSAFADCSRLTSITIGNSVTSIDEWTFSSCPGLTSITCNATTAPIIKSNTFYRIKSGGTLTVPTGSTGYDAWMTILGNGWTKVEQ